MDLYALAPEEFTSARDAEVKRAREDGNRERAKQLAALRRPTAAAHAINVLVRAEAALVQQLQDLGEQLAQAQAAGEGSELRKLGTQRRQLVEAMADRAAAVAAGNLSSAVRTEVVATLEAALADPASGQAVSSGRLVRALTYAGFGGVDLQGAVAEAPAQPARGGRPPGQTQVQAPENARGAERAHGRRLEQAQRAALAAAGLLDGAVQAARTAEAERAAGAEEAERAAEQVQAAEQQLSEARERRAGAQTSERRAVRDLDRAHAQVTRAQQAAEQARAALERLGSSVD